MLGSEVPGWLNPWLFLWCISVHHCCQLPNIFDLLFGAIFTQGKGSLPHIGIQGAHPCSSCRHHMSSLPLCVMSPSAGALFSQSCTQFCPRKLPQLLLSGRHRLFTCFCYAMCLKPYTLCLVILPPPPSMCHFVKFGGGGGVPLCSEELCTPLHY